MIFTIMQQGAATRFTAEVADVKEYPRAVALEELGIKRASQSWQYMR